MELWFPKMFCTKSNHIPMNLNLILILLFAFGALVCSSEGVKNAKDLFVGWCTTLLLLSVTCKSAFYGTQNGGGADTLVYIQEFKEVIDMSFDDIWEAFLDRYIRGVGDYDIGYLLLQWVVSMFSSSYHVFSTIADLLFFIPFAKILKKYCSTVIEVFFAVLLYLSLFHTFAMYGARQFYAMGFGLMFFLCYSEKKYIKGSVALLLGMTIHMSSLLVLIPFALSFLPDKTVKTTHWIALLLIPVVWLVANPIISYMGDFIGMEKYAAYGEGEMQGGATTYILLSEILSIICLVLTNKQCFEDVKFKYLYAMAPVFTFFAPLIASNGSMIRVTAYSQVFIIVLLPYLMAQRFGNKSKAYMFVMILALCFLMLKGGHYPYEFFWVSDPEYLW